MMNANKKTPKLRFKGFTDDWEQRKLSELTTMNARIGWQNLRTSEFLDSGDYLLITGTDFDNGRIKYSTCHYVEKKRFDQDTKIQLSTGSILITKDGTLGKVALVEELPKPATLNAGVFNVRVKDDTLLSYKYLYHYLKAPFLMKYVTANATGGTIKHLNQSILVDFPIPIAEKHEQDKIAKLLDSLELIITLHQRKIEKLKLNKSALLQKMFPQNRCAVPEVRFKGFAEDWEQRKLSDVLVERNEQEVETREYPLMSFVQGLGVVPKGERYDRSFLVLDQSKKYKRTELGDFIYSSNNLETGSIGINKTGKAVISPVYSIFQGVSIGDSQFIGIMSLLPKFIAKMIRFRQGVVYGQWRIHETDFLDISVLIPSVDERTKITQLILSIEEIIILHQRKLDRLMSIKKALLQQLFV
ncbi:MULTISPECIES: restriction endonuclease subunit S [Veillonella]|jgi:restriction endonuclease S subunits family protein|nr:MULTISPECIES: restriction endonuclease subunit S [Veillonella]MDU2302161.1 restriction endonuclease subunit S [Veillonella sp.]MDU2388975.1 restriction endonuclease subunit S [Veillonella sp.]